METWIFLVVMGSGYLAQRWKNATKMKEASMCKSNDFQPVLSSTNHLVSPTKRGFRNKKRRSKRNHTEGNTSSSQLTMPICSFFSLEGRNLKHRSNRKICMHRMESAIDGDHFKVSHAFYGSDMLSYSNDFKSLSLRLGEIVSENPNMDKRCGNDFVRSNTNVRTRGFPLRRKHFGRQRTMSTRRNFLLDKVGEGSMDSRKTGKPSSTSLGRKEKVQSDAHDGRQFHNEGALDLKSLLFNFSVGVGMMSKIMSNMRNGNNLVRPIEEAEWLLEGLESELDWRASCYEGLFGSLDDKIFGMKDMLARLRSTLDLLNGVRKQLWHELERSESASYHSKEMSKMEAELKSELERMGADLDARCLLSDPGMNSFDSTGGHLIDSDESYISNPLYDELFGRMEEECSSCNSEDAHFFNTGVSPVKLANCLHELIEERQEEEILELKNELRFMQRKLQANERELHLWKKGVIGISGKALASYDETQAEFNQLLGDEATSPSTVTSTVYAIDEDMACSGNKFVKDMNGKGKACEIKRSLWPDDDDSGRFLSMIEDSSSDANSEWTVEIPTPCKGTCSCPEPKQASGSLRYAISPDNMVIRRSDMAPSSMKSAFQSHSTKCATYQSKRKMINDSHEKAFNFEWSFSPEQMLADASQDVIAENHGKFRSAAFDWSMSQESS